MNKNKKKPVKPINKRLTALVAAVAMLFTPVHAVGLVDSKLGKGLVNLVNDISALGIILCPLVGAAAWAIFMIRKSIADEQDGKMWQKRAITALACGGAGMLGSAIITLITSYFT